VQESRAQIRSKDEAGMKALSDRSKLGAGDALKTKINGALAAQGLKEATRMAVSGPPKMS